MLRYETTMRPLSQVSSGLPVLFPRPPVPKYRCRVETVVHCTDRPVERRRNHLGDRGGSEESFQFSSSSLVLVEELNADPIQRVRQLRDTSYLPFDRPRVGGLALPAQFDSHAHAAAEIAGQRDEIHSRAAEIPSAPGHGLKPKVVEGNAKGHPDLRPALLPPVRVGPGFKPAIVFGKCTEPVHSRPPSVPTWNRL